MFKSNQLKFIAEDILDNDKPVYEKDVLKEFKYKQGCDIISIRHGIRNLKPENINVKNVIKILENNLEVI